jgi:hypothetical protein
MPSFPSGTDKPKDDSPNHFHDFTSGVTGRMSGFLSGMNDHLRGPEYRDRIAKMSAEHSTLEEKLKQTEHNRKLREVGQLGAEQLREAKHQHKTAMLEKDHDAEKAALNSQYRGHMNNQRLQAEADKRETVSELKRQALERVEEAKAQKDAEINDRDRAIKTLDQKLHSTAIDHIIETNKIKSSAEKTELTLKASMI